MLYCVTGPSFFVTNCTVNCTYSDYILMGFSCRKTTAWRRPLTWVWVEFRKPLWWQSTRLLLLFVSLCGEGGIHHACVCVVAALRNSFSISTECDTHWFPAVVVGCSLFKTLLFFCVSASSSDNNAARTGWRQTQKGFNFICIWPWRYTD